MAVFALRSNLVNVQEFNICVFRDTSPANDEEHVEPSLSIVENQVREIRRWRLVRLFLI